MKFLMIFVFPWLAVGALYVLWAYISYRLSDRFPRYYAFVGKLYDNTPKIVAVILILAFIYFSLNGNSTYDE